MGRGCRRPHSRARGPGSGPPGPVTCRTASPGWPGGRDGSARTGTPGTGTRRRAFAPRCMCRRPPATSRRRPNLRRSELLVLLQVPADRDGAVERAVRLLRFVLDVDLAEVQRDLVHRDHVRRLRSAGLERRHQDVVEGEREKFLLALAGLATREQRGLEVLPARTGEDQRRARLVEPHDEVEVLHLHLAGASASAFVARGLRLAPGPRLDVDLALVLGVGALARDPIDPKEVVARCQAALTRLVWPER